MSLTDGPPVWNIEGTKLGDLFAKKFRREKSMTDLEIQKAALEKLKLAQSQKMGPSAVGYVGSMSGAIPGLPGHGTTAGQFQPGGGLLQDPPPQFAQQQGANTAMPKAVHVSGWFRPDDPGAHPEHPIVIPPEGPVDPDYGIPGPPYPHPEHPIVIPPLVGIWPSPGHPAHPIVIPEPPPASGPVYIEGTPEKPITSAPGTLTPALPAGTLPPGKVALLVTIPGVDGNRWLTVDMTPTVNPLGR